MKLLLAEDEKELSNALVAVLNKNGYLVDAVYNGTDAYEYAAATQYSGVILDIMMPGMNGLQVVEKLRKEGNQVPILMLTAKSQIEDKIIGLDAGADDYLSKPFSMGELLARVRAITRRRGEYTPNRIQMGNITLDKGSFLLANETESIRLTNKEYQLMEYLMSNPNVLISTEKLMEAIWGYEAEAEINVVWVGISSLRKKMQNLHANLEIKASRGVGYSLEVIKT